MEEERIWRVKMLYGYRNVFFDFDTPDDAADFIRTCALHFNKDMSEDKKDLIMNMSYVNKDQEEDD